MRTDKKERLSRRSIQLFTRGGVDYSLSKPTGQYQRRSKPTSEGEAQGPNSAVQSTRRLRRRGRGELRILGKKGENPSPPNSPPRPHHSFRFKSQPDSYIRSNSGSASGEKPQMRSRCRRTYADHSPFMHVDQATHDPAYVTHQPDVQTNNDNHYLTYLSCFA